ncbi:hypothetical protein ACFL9T_03270 [Thermodesulfobacteriota bacterium]
MQVGDPVLSGGAEERRLRRMCNTPQEEAIDGNPAGGGTDDAFVVDQGPRGLLTCESRRTTLTGNDLIRVCTGLGHQRPYLLRGKT